ncbi:MAG TPA: hypothetical protein VES36_07420 [Candidatus Limnocylindrales bacterium]|nr:hypothetical protein [Candidatus Limnocylindrales bacterium]
MTGLHQPAVEWLLHSREPAIRGMARRDLLGERDPDDLGRVLGGPIVRALLSGQQPDGSFGNDPYRKWTGAHWRLVSLVELELPEGEPRAMAALETVLNWLTGHRSLAPGAGPMASSSATGQWRATPWPLPAAWGGRTMRAHGSWRRH